MSAVDVEHQHHPMRVVDDLDLDEAGRPREVAVAPGVLHLRPAPPRRRPGRGRGAVTAATPTPDPSTATDVPIAPVGEAHQVALVTALAQPGMREGGAQGWASASDRSQMLRWPSSSTVMNAARGPL